jgi:CRP-like cAMP-binding protein
MEIGTNTPASSARTSPDEQRNRILSMLHRDDFERLRPMLERLTVNQGDVFSEANEPPRHVYFPASGVASLVMTTAEGWTVEVASVGNEGVVGIEAFLGGASMPMRVIQQIPGEADRIDAGAFAQEVARGGSLARVLQLYSQALMTQFAQNVVCNRVHPLGARAARWLMLTHDRVDGDTFPLTQEFLAMMLGVHRPRVTVAQGILQRAGLIAYSRGSVTVLDRPGLEQAACDCYNVLEHEFERLLAAPRG